MQRKCRKLSNERFSFEWKKGNTTVKFFIKINKKLIMNFDDLKNEFYKVCVNLI